MREDRERHRTACERRIGEACIAGLPAEVVEGISGHSTRVGATQDMVAGGVPMAAIQQAGRWKTTAMVNLYC